LASGDVEAVYYAGGQGFSIIINYI